MGWGRGRRRRHLAAAPAASEAFFLSAPKRVGNTPAQETKKWKKRNTKKNDWGRKRNEQKKTIRTQKRTPPPSQRSIQNRTQREIEQDEIRKMAAVSGFSFVWFFGFGLLFVPRVRLPFPMEHDGEFHGNGTNQRRPETESKKQATKKTINRTGVVFFCFFFYSAEWAVEMDDDRSVGSSAGSGSKKWTLLPLLLRLLVDKLLAGSSSKMPPVRTSKSFWTDLFFKKE